MLHISSEGLKDSTRSELFQSYVICLSAFNTSNTCLLIQHLKYKHSCKLLCNCVNVRSCMLRVLCVLGYRRTGGWLGSDFSLCVPQHFALSCISCAVVTELTSPILLQQAPLRQIRSQSEQQISWKFGTPGLWGCRALGRAQAQSTLTNKMCTVHTPRTLKTHKVLPPTHMPHTHRAHLIPSSSDIAGTSTHK